MQQGGRGRRQGALGSRDEDGKLERECRMGWDVRKRRRGGDFDGTGMSSR
jgi:hypothetical protein